MTDDVHAAAEKLKQRFFELMSRANQPDVIWDEDGPRWGNTYTQAESPALNEAVEDAERELDEFLRQHRSELAGDPRWAAFYVDVDNRDFQLAGAEGNIPAGSADDQTERRRDEREQWARDSRPSSPAPEPPSGRGSGRRAPR